MIQEISPHQFHNEFHIKTPTENSYFFCFRENQILLKREDELSIPRFSDLETLCSELPGDDSLTIYLFSIDAKDYFLLDEGRIGNYDPAVLNFYNTSVIRELEPMWTAFAAANGHQMYRFYRINQFCGCCGQRLHKSTRERAMVCPDCGNTVYPKIAPAVIVAITDGSRLLLTKYAGRDYTRYALVAGYTEFGETLEETVRREVMEEVGLKVKNIRYYKNQPWAFSDTLLVGFFAELDGSPQIHLDETELSTAVWMERGDIPNDYTNVSLTHEMILQFKQGQ